MTTPVLPPLTPSTVMAALALVDNPGWGRKSRIVGLVGAYQGGLAISSHELAHCCGLSERRVRVVLGELEGDQIIIRTGKRRPWLEVNPAVLEWRNIRWSVPVETGELEARLAWHAKTADRPLAERIIGTRNYSRYGQIFGRSNYSRYVSEPSDYRHPWEVPITRGDGPLSAVHRAAAGNPIIGRNWNGRKNGASPKRGTNSLDAFDSSSCSESPDGEQQEEESMVSSAHMARAYRAVLRVAGTGRRGEKYLRGQAWYQAQALVRLHGIGRFEATAAQVPPDQMLVPDVVNWIESHIGQDAQEEIAVLEGVERVMRSQLREKLLERLAKLHEQLAFAILESDDSDQVEWLRQRIKECENDLAALGTEEDQ